MTVQIRNAEMVDLLKADFQHRNEANFAWRAACSMFQALPGLRGFWPMSSFDENGDAFDLSEQDRVMGYHGDPVYNAYDLAPYIDLDGTGDYLDRTDEAGLDITGIETYVAIPGVTCGGWFWVDTIGATQGLITKWDAAQRSYTLEINAAGEPAGHISDDGSFDVGHHDDITADDSITAQTWFFAAFTWSPTSTGIWVNGTEKTAASTLASIHVGTADLWLGGYPGPASLLTGYMSMVFLCAAQLPSVTLFSLYQQSRRMFYV